MILFWIISCTTLIKVYSSYRVSLQGFNRKSWTVKLPKVLWSHSLFRMKMNTGAFNGNMKVFSFSFLFLLLVCCFNQYFSLLNLRFIRVLLYDFRWYLSLCYLKLNTKGMHAICLSKCPKGFTSDYLHRLVNIMIYILLKYLLNNWALGKYFNLVYYDYYGGILC